MLNMSFFQTEVSVIRMEKKTRAQLENLIRMVNSGMEEESDATTEGAATDRLERDIDFFHQDVHDHSLASELYCFPQHTPQEFSIPQGRKPNPSTPPPRA